MLGELIMPSGGWIYIQLGEQEGGWKKKPLFQVWKEKDRKLPDSELKSRELCLGWY